MRTAKQTKQKLSFDQYAGKYDAWFMENENLFLSELSVVAYFLDKPGRALSVGCGSGLFEYFLQKNYGIAIKEGIEPSESMAEIARKRGMSVDIATAEEAELETQAFDTLLFNGTPSYIGDLDAAFEKAYYALKKGGRLIVADVPKEGSFAMLYNLAKTLNTWDHSMLKDIRPSSVYPIEFVKEANWRSTREKADLVKKTGFSNLRFAQTLTTHPLYSNDYIEEALEGYDKGNYVAICANK
ncbi:MAG: class I SAM-dependent DNA methyltransferase [Bacteroidales bacterium]